MRNNIKIETERKKDEKTKKKIKEKVSEKIEEKVKERMKEKKKNKYKRRKKQPRVNHKSKYMKNWGGKKNLNKDFKNIYKTNKKNILNLLTMFTKSERKYMWISLKAII